MGKFDRLLADGLEGMRERLLAKGWSSTEIADFSARIERLNFAGLLGVLATAKKRSGPLGVELLRGAAFDAAAETATGGLEAAAVQGLLTGVFGRHQSLTDLGAPGLGAPELKNKVFERAVASLARRSGIAITPDQAKQVASLVASGEFFRDIASATAVALFALRGIPLALAADLKWSPRAIFVLLALMRDLRGTPFSVRTLFFDLLDGEIDEPPAVLSHTLRALYATASVAAISEMIRTLIAKDNQTIRLAIVLYARSAGIPIEDADLDVLRESVFNTGNPDLGPALVRAIERLEGHFGRDILKGVLEHLA